MAFLLTILGIIGVLVIYAFVENSIQKRKKMTEQACLDISKDLQDILKSNFCKYSVITNRFKNEQLYQVISVTHKNIKGFRNIDFAISTNSIVIKVSDKTFTLNDVSEFSDVLSQYNLIENEQ